MRKSMEVCEGHSAAAPLRVDQPSSEVQFGQRLALIGMFVKQRGHSLVIGVAGAGAGLRCRLLIPLIIRKMARATIRK